MYAAKFSTSLSRSTPIVSRLRNASLTIARGFTAAKLRTLNLLLRNKYQIIHIS